MKSRLQPLIPHPVHQVRDFIRLSLSLLINLVIFSCYQVPAVSIQADGTSAPMEIDPPTNAPSMQSSPEPNASWWNYVGLGSGKSSSTALPAPDSPNTLHSPTSGEAGDSSTPIPSSDHHTRAEGEVMEVQTPPEERPASITSGQTTGSAWFMPRGWYEWYSKPTDVPHAPAIVKTEAEMIKEDPLARPNPPTPLPSEAQPSPSSPTPTQEPVNPIVSSLGANMNGWTSFFSSRSLTVKSITEKGESGMEVMDIDEDEAESGPVTVKAEDENATGKTLPPPSNAVASSASSMKSKDTPVGPPLTSSDSIKRKVAKGVDKRSASPTPSKRSIPSPTPRPPNLVLPTFDDTFRTLPRSRPPPTGSTASAIKKTLGYVSNVLFAREQDNSGSQKGKGKARQVEHEDFGKELPRAWDVLGESPGSQSLASCKRVVVIGVHGWFPGWY